MPLVALSPFADSGAHLRAELAWVHELVRSELRPAGAGGTAPDEFAGVYISRDEIDGYLRQEPASGGKHHSDAGDRRQSDAVADARHVLDRRAHLSLTRGVDLRLERIAREFSLDAPARIAMLCAVAAELDLQIGRLFAYLQNDAGRKRPTFALLARLIGRGAADSVELRRLFGPASPLFTERLIDAAADGSDTALPAREARPAPGLVEFIVGSDQLPQVIAGGGELPPPHPPAARLAYHRHHDAIVEALLRRRDAEVDVPLCYVGGAAGSGRRLIAEDLAAALGKGLIHVRWAKLRAAAGPLDDAARILRREARLRNCLVLLDGIDVDLAAAEAERPAPNPLASFLQHLSGATVLAIGTTAPDEVRYRLGVPMLGFALPQPASGEREEAWHRALPGNVGAQLAADIPLLAQKFRFTPGQIADAVHTAVASAGPDVNGRTQLTSAHVHACCREQAQRGLHLFCQKITPRFDWADIVLPPDTQAQLREICRWVKHRAQVYDAWGFGAKQAVGRGVTVLFSGASGTGKTMSAEIIAADLQLDLFRVDLSRIVSKYIGETEKNLSRVFEQAATSSCVLFFDEADALFGKRTEVKDAHDRYANIEINYLLTEMDQYEGIIILSTNLKGNLDSAFIRRFSHVVEYPLPDGQLRETIWRNAFPAHMPLAGDVDFAFLAQRFTLAGGNIKNIVLTGAFLAANDARPLGMEHLILATKREYQKIGRICSKSDFGQYYGLVREAGVA